GTLGPAILGSPAPARWSPTCPSRWERRCRHRPARPSRAGCIPAAGSRWRSCSGAAALVGTRLRGIPPIGQEAPDHDVAVQSATARPARPGQVLARRSGDARPAGPVQQWREFDEHSHIGRRDLDRVRRVRGGARRRRRRWGLQRPEALPGHPDRRAPGSALHGLQLRPARARGQHRRPGVRGRARGRGPRRCDRTHRWLGQRAGVVVRSGAVARGSGGGRADHQARPARTALRRRRHPSRRAATHGERARGAGFDGSQRRVRDGLHDRDGPAGRGPRRHGAEPDVARARGSRPHPRLRRRRDRRRPGTAGPTGGHDHRTHAGDRLRLQPAVAPEHHRQGRRHHPRRAARHAHRSGPLHHEPGRPRADPGRVLRFAAL
ncbi:MAG: hypothetical protein AVDCRST_MAG66-4366, partial [uncultured Pseudonocardia sp.]